MIQFTEQEKRLLAQVQDSIPLVPEPFAVIAESVGITGSAVIENLKTWQESGEIRRFGGVVRHRHLGFVANAMSVWAAPPEKVEGLGTILAARHEVSHCYERACPVEWPYTIFAMIHGKSVDACHRVAREVAETTGIHDYELLFTVKEFKKSSLHIF